MSTPGDDATRPGTESDARGRRVVWSAGSPVPRPHPRAGALRRWAGLLGATAVASFALAYAVHAQVVIAPAPTDPAAPLWLPAQLPADDPAVWTSPASPRATPPARERAVGVTRGRGPEASPSPEISPSPAASAGSSSLRTSRHSSTDDGRSRQGTHGSGGSRGSDDHGGRGHGRSGGSEDSGGSDGSDDRSGHGAGS